MNTFADFAWYWNNYNTLTYTKCLGAYGSSEYKNIPFEFKIGLLKYICYNLHFKSIDFANLLMDIALGNYKNPKYESIKQIVKICPEDFLSSIFN